jgi:hypothetical protein
MASVANFHRRRHFTCCGNARIVTKLRETRGISFDFDIDDERRCVRVDLIAVIFVDRSSRIVAERKRKFRYHP